MWKVVQSRTRPNKPKQNVLPKTLISIEEVKVKTISIMLKYCPKTVIIFGSTARETHKTESDIDILVVWKRIVPDNSVQIKLELETMFKKKVDLVNMIYIEKDYEEVGQRKDLIDNINSDGIVVIGEKYDIFKSVLVNKTV